MPPTIDKRVYHFNLIGNAPTEINASTFLKKNNILQQRIYRFGKRNSTLNFEKLSVLCVYLCDCSETCASSSYIRIVLCSHSWVRACVREWTNKDKVNTYTEIKEPGAGHWHKTVKSNRVERTNDKRRTSSSSTRHFTPYWILGFYILNSHTENKKNIKIEP